MKFIGKLLLYILIALLVVIAGLYFLLQTRWGAEHISAWVSENSRLSSGLRGDGSPFFRAISYRAGERHVWP